MVIASTTLTPAAFCSADDPRVVQRTNRAAAGQGRGAFYCTPGRELGGDFSTAARRIRTYGRSSQHYETATCARFASRSRLFKRLTFCLTRSRRAKTSAPAVAGLPQDGRRASPRDATPA